MRLGRMRLWAAGIVAFLMGVPLTEKALAGGTFDAVTSGFDLAFALADSAGGS